MSSLSSTSVIASVRDVAGSVATPTQLVRRPVCRSPSLRRSLPLAPPPLPRLALNELTYRYGDVLAVGIQLGFAGIVLLLAMWISHLALFRGAGLAGWVGLVVVIQNIVGSQFNSHLFDFTHGWFYVVGVGVAGGAVLKQSIISDGPHHGGFCPE